jgi:20S proteasome subunit beta 2
LVLAGVDCKGPHLYTIAAHGSTDKVPYSAMGSGSMAAMAVLETGYRADMEEEEAKKLVRDAIAAGIINDMGSGSNIDLAVLKANDQIDYLRPYEKLISKGVRKNEYKYAKGTTAVLSSNVFEIEDVEVRSVPMEDD